MQLIAKDGLLLRRDFAELGAIGFPVSSGAGDQVELYDRYGQTINDTLAILGQVHHLQHGLANQVDGKHQVAATAVEPATLRDMREQIVYTQVQKPAKSVIMAMSSSKFREWLVCPIYTLLGDKISSSRRTSTRS